MAAPTYAINPTHTHIYSYSNEYDADSGDLSIPANGVLIYASTTVDITLANDNAAITYISTHQTFLPLRVKRVNPTSEGGKVVLFW